MPESEMTEIPDEQIVARLRDKLRTADLRIVTERQLRQTLEEEFKTDLSKKKHVIRTEVTRYLEEQEDASAEADEAAQAVANGTAQTAAQRDSENDDADEAEPVRKKRKAGGGFGAAFLSPEMQEFLGEQSLPRTQVVKRLWEYIKANNLQKPQDKRKIILDEQLAKLFKPPLDMFTINKQISRHCKQDDRGDIDETDASSLPAPKKKAKQKKSDADGEPKQKRVIEHKKVPLSKAMGEWYGEPQATRPELIMHLWKYVKERDLQDPADKKCILADETLLQLTGERRFTGFSFSRLMQPHLNPT